MYDDHGCDEEKEDCEHIRNMKNSRIIEMEKRIKSSKGYETPFPDQKPEFTTWQVEGMLDQARNEEWGYYLPRKCENHDSQELQCKNDPNYIINQEMYYRKTSNEEWTFTRYHYLGYCKKHYKDGLKQGNRIDEPSYSYKIKNVWEIKKIRF